MRKVSLGDISRTTQYAWSLVGTPYKLGGNVPQDGGMDCSAFCLELLRSMGAWNTTDATCQMIFDEFQGKKVNTKVEGRVLAPTSDILEGDLLFFGASTDKLTHMAYAIGQNHMLEAGGTDRTGMIRLRKTTWRTDLQAIVRLN